MEVTFLAYRGTLQGRALGLVAAKVKAALLVGGELPDDGLAGLDADDHDRTLALARRLVDADAADDASLEAMFASNRALASAADDPLVPDGDDDRAQGPSPVGTSAGLTPATTQTLRFEELAALLRPAKTTPRRKSVAANQLTLFGE